MINYITLVYNGAVINIDIIGSTYVISDDLTDSNDPTLNNALCICSGAIHVKFDVIFVVSCVQK